MSIGPHVRSTRVPAMAWLEWNPDGDDWIRWSEASNVIGDTVRWTAPQVLTDRRTSDVPSVAGTGTGTVMAWKGSGTDRHIWYSRLNRLPDPDAAGTQYVWGPQLPAGDGHYLTVNFPTLAQLGTRMLMFWKSAPFTRDYPLPDYPNQLMIAELRGDTWGNIGPGPPYTHGQPFEYMRTDDGVAAAEHQGLLYVAWREAGAGGRQILVSTPLDSDHSTSFADNRATTKAPALASEGDRMHMAWRNVDNDHISWSMLEGTFWTPPQVLDDRRTAGSPALARTNRGVVMVWIGTNGNTLWWSQFDNGSWTPQQPFTDRHTNLIDLSVGLA